MQINGPFAPTPALIQSVRPAEITAAGSSGTSAAKTLDQSFGSAVTNALESLDQTQKGAELEIARAVAGESPDLHKTVIALQTADLQFQLAMQVRNKVVGAYEEIMRMQV